MNTDVIFRKSKSGAIIAFLLNIPTEITGEMCKTVCNGNFGSMSYKSARNRTDACESPKEYEQAMDYLFSIGYCVNIVPKYLHEHYRKIRLENLKRELGG